MAISRKCCCTVWGKECERMVAKTDCEIISDFQSLNLLGLNTYLPPRKKKNKAQKLLKDGRLL